MDFFSQALQSEYEDKGIIVDVDVEVVQWCTLAHEPVFTDIQHPMLKGLSDDIQTSNFLVPRADVYAA